MELNLYQIQYDDETSALSDSGFLTYDCRAKPEFLKREIAHLIRFYHEIVVRADTEDYFSLLSPKFNYKTGLTAQHIKEFITNNPEQDVYLFNPYPIHIYNYMNVWEQAKLNHPEILNLADDLFRITGINFKTTELHRNSIHQVIYCNYWVAKKSFFDQFIPFLQLLDDAIENMPVERRASFFAETNYRSPACCYPFIFERLLTTYLYLHPRIKSKAYEFSQPFKGYHYLNRIERKFYYGDSRKMFDQWERVNQPDIQEIEKVIKVITSILRPQIYTPYVGKLLRSLVKSFNIYQIDKIIRDNIKENIK